MKTPQRSLRVKFSPVCLEVEGSGKFRDAAYCYVPTVLRHLLSKFVEEELGIDECRPLKVYLTTQTRTGEGRQAALNARTGLRMMFQNRTA